MSAIDWYGARLADRARGESILEISVSQAPYLLRSRSMYTCRLRGLPSGLLSVSCETPFEHRREEGEGGGGALTSFVPESLRANSLSGNWVFSSAIRRPRYIYVGCSIRREKGMEGEAGWGTPTVIENVSEDGVWPCRTNGGQTRSDVLGELSTTTCDRCPSHD